MLGLGGDGDDCNGRFLTRPNAMAAAAATVAYGRPQHPYAGKFVYLSEKLPNYIL
jgi:hypothetical protein